MIRGALVIVTALGGGTVGLLALAGWWVRRRLRRFGRSRVRYLTPTRPMVPELSGLTDVMAGVRELFDQDAPDRRRS